MALLASTMMNVLSVTVVLPAQPKKDPFSDVDLTSTTFAITLLVALNASVKTVSKKLTVSVLVLPNIPLELIHASMQLLTFSCLKSILILQSLLLAIPNSLALAQLNQQWLPMVVKITTNVIMFATKVMPLKSASTSTSSMSDSLILAHAPLDTEKRSPMPLLIQLLLLTTRF